MMDTDTQSLIDQLRDRMAGMDTSDQSILIKRIVDGWWDVLENDAATHFTGIESLSLWRIK